MTSAFEQKRGGILVAKVMLCAQEPPCIAVAIPKGHRIATLVRDSHAFCVNLVDPKHRLVLKKFENGSEADAFELLENKTLATGSPCLARALCCLDCDVMRHFDLEADHEMYIGQVLAAWVPGQSGATAASAPRLTLAGAGPSRPMPAAAGVGLATGTG